MWRKLFGMPRSDITIVTWCSASGSRVQKSQLLSALRRPVRGSRLIAWLRSGKRSGSRKKNTGVLLPTMSQVAFLGVELHRGAAYVTLHIRRAAFARDGGEAHEERRLLAGRGEDL